MKYIKSGLSNKKALEMSFTWIFAIVVGAIILVFAIYFASRLIETGQYGVNTKTARDFANLFEPLQTSVGEKSIMPIGLVTDTRVYVSCDLEGNFGRNIIQLSEKSGFSKDWTKPGGDIKIPNHYIFAENMIQGKEFYFFTVPFEMPFKVADLMIVYSDSYCFVNAPEDIKGLINALENNTNLFVASSPGKCKEDTKKVCFGSGGVSCDISITCYDSACESGSVRKGRIEEVFTQGLLYGAIFGSVENYNCSVKRLMDRLSELSRVYKEKAIFVSGKGCTTGLEEDMNLFSEMTKSYRKSQDLIIIDNKAKEIEEKNRNLACELF